jgi:tRNA threonylcarbamoyl adenosine modification protein YeaZ
VTSVLSPCEPNAAGPGCRKSHNPRSKKSILTQKPEFNLFPSKAHLLKKTTHSEFDLNTRKRYYAFFHPNVIFGKSGKKNELKYTNMANVQKNTLKPLILAVETSGRLGSVALAAGPQLLAEAEFSAALRHSAEIFIAADRLLKDFDRRPDQIEQIYISAGPGSFTGLRIAVTIAKIMHLANNIKIVALDTLDLIAQNAIDYIKAEKKTIDRIAVVLDAKRGQFFISVYENKNLRQSEAKNADAKRESESEATAAASTLSDWAKILPPSLMTADHLVTQFAKAQRPLWLLGEGLVYYKDKFETGGIEFFDESLWTPKASLVHRIGWEKALCGQFAEPMSLVPFYIQRLDIRIKK